MKNLDNEECLYFISMCMFIQITRVNVWAIHSKLAQEEFMYNNSEHSFWTHVYLECLHMLYDMGFIYNHLRSFVPTFCAVWFLPKTESTVTIFRLNTKFLRKRWQILEFSLPHSDTNLQIFQICSQLLPSNFWISLSSTVYWAYHSSRTTYLTLYINLL